tara:strand:+ start:7139 stop:7867 length:729 start_codon:yes stop_codon:yes gene_type:complete
MTSSFGGNMISIHLWILFSFVILKLFVADIFLSEMHQYSKYFLFLYSVFFLIYLFSFNIKLTSNDIICGSSNTYIAGMATLFPYIFVYGLGMSLIYLFNGWLRSFSNTFGLSIIRLCGYSSFIQERINANKTNDTTIQSTMKMIYNNPDVYINELDINDETHFEAMIQEFDTNVNDETMKEYKKYINMKESVGTYIWVAIFSVLTILTSQNTLLAQNCTTKLEDQTEFNSYLMSQLSSSSSS